MTYTKETETAVFRAALAKWGAHAQSIVALEELAELQKEICKQERGGGDVNHLAEEIADVEIMLAQLKLLHNCVSEVITWRAAKVDRLEKKIANGGCEVDGR